jgi:O-antigen ligase
MKKNKIFEIFLTSHSNIFFLFAVFPLSIILGSLAINLNILIISLIFLYNLMMKKINHIFQSRIFLLLVFFLITLLINLIFTNNLSLSLPRVIKFFFVIFFIFSFKYTLLNLSDNQKEELYKIWSIIFIFIVFDLMIEFYRGENIIGLKSVMPNVRLASFTGRESVIGNYFYGFVLIFLTYFYNNFSKKVSINLLLAIFLIVVSFLIGERANFIRTFTIIVLFIFFIYDFKVRNKILTLLVLSLLLISFISSNSKYKTRYFDQISMIFTKNGISSYLNNSHYGAHYNVAKEIFKDNYFFGVGIKNFRIESAKDKYNNLKHPRNHMRVASHPHQLHYEFLSETGLFGYFSFLLFIFLSLYWSIKNYLINKNIYQLSSILFILISLLPLVPTGSFLSTYTSSIFWINYAIMVGYNDLKN